MLHHGPTISSREPGASTRAAARLRVAARWETTSLTRRRGERGERWTCFAGARPPGALGPGRFCGPGGTSASGEFPSPPTLPPLCPEPETKSPFTAAPRAPPSCPVPWSGIHLAAAAGTTTTTMAGRGITQRRQCPLRRVMPSSWHQRHCLRQARRRILLRLVKKT